MKKLALTLTLASLALSTAAVADDHGHKDGKKGKNKVSKKFEKMDSDKDGSVSKEEFISYKTKKFEKIDANSDGNITLEEKKDYKKAKHEERKANHKAKKMEEKSE